MQPAQPAQQQLNEQLAAAAATQLSMARPASMSLWGRLSDVRLAASRTRQQPGCMLFLPASGELGACGWLTHTQLVSSAAAGVRRSSA